MNSAEFFCPKVNKTEKSGKLSDFRTHSSLQHRPLS